jgi:hypothetical protein
MRSAPSSISKIAGSKIPDSPESALFCPKAALV